MGLAHWGKNFGEPKRLPLAGPSREREAADVLNFAGGGNTREGIARPNTVASSIARVVVIAELGRPGTNHNPKVRSAATLAGYAGLPNNGARGSGVIGGGGELAYIT